MKDRESFEQHKHMISGSQPLEMKPEERAREERRLGIREAELRREETKQPADEEEEVELDYSQRRLPYSIVTG